MVFKRDMAKRHKYAEIDPEKFLERNYDEAYGRERNKRLKGCAVTPPMGAGVGLFFCNNAGKGEGEGEGEGGKKGKEGKQGKQGKEGE